MADTNNNSPASSSPLSPQIKIPAPPTPRAPQSSGSFGLPANLPIIPSKPVSAPTSPTIQPQPPVMPSKPLSPPPAPIMPASPAPMPPRPANIAPIAPQSPAPAPVSSSAPGELTFKSSIRTMAEDIEALKKGKMPSGAQVEKQIEKPAAPVAVAPKVTPAPIQAPALSSPEMGSMQKSKILPSMPTPKPPVTNVIIPEAKKNIFGSKFLIYSLLAIAVFGAIGWFVISRQNPEVAYTPAPTYAVSPTASPVPVIKPAIESALNTYPITITASESIHLFSAIEANNAKVNIKTSDPALYAVSQPGLAGLKLASFSDLMKLASVNVPQAVASSLDAKVSYLSIFTKADNTNSYGFAVRVSDSIAAVSALRVWEATMPTDFKSLFKLNLLKSVSNIFLDNTYQAVPIRYRNFSTPGMTIDYAIVTVNNEKYLIVTNSRDQIYAIIDKVLGYVPGK